MPEHHWKFINDDLVMWVSPIGLYELRRMPNRKFSLFLQGMHRVDLKVKSWECAAERADSVLAEECDRMLATLR